MSPGGTCESCGSGYTVNNSGLGCVILGGYTNFSYFNFAEVQVDEEEEAVDEEEEVVDEEEEVVDEEEEVVDQEEVVDEEEEAVEEGEENP